MNHYPKRNSTDKLVHVVLLLNTRHLPKKPNVLAVVCLSRMVLVLKIQV